MTHVLTVDKPVIQSSIKSKRIDVIDVLRGFALLGILLVHSYHTFIFKNPDYASPVKDLMEPFVNNFISAKFYSIFSFLFGLGFAIQIRSAEAKGVSFTGRYVWRLAILFMIGTLHAVIFPGDVLRIYACLGGLLLLVNKWSNNKLLIFSALLFALSVLIIVNKTLLDRATSNYLTSDNVYMEQLFNGRLLTTASLFLLGLYAGRQNVFAQSTENNQLFKKLALCGVVVIVLISTFTSWANSSGYFSDYSFAVIKTASSSIRKIVTSAIYVSAIVLAYYFSSGKKVLDWLTPIGKLGMTTYIIQSVFLFIFYDVLVHSSIIRSISLEMAMAITILFFFSQILFAKWWLSYFKMGPMEWIWRSLTYFNWQPIRK